MCLRALFYFTPTLLILVSLHLRIYIKFLKIKKNEFRSNRQINCQESYTSGK